jgi:shikimate dehydrogenase
LKFALIGHPVSHSLSPVIHGAAYRELGQEHEYELLDAPGEADFDRVLESLKSGALAGANVTIPWKRRAFAAADRHSGLAERLQVANVLAPGAGQIVAHNTDALALEAELRRLVSSPRAIVLGSGGATPAVVAACQAAGIADVFVSARRFAPQTAESSWPGAAELVRLGARLIAWTSAGMQGADSGEPLAALVPWPLLAADALAYDLIYAPLETPFLRRAREAGRRTMHGLHMLVGQAALSVEIWLGRRPPAEPLLAAALDALAKRSRA